MLFCNFFFFLTKIVDLSLFVIYFKAMITFDALFQQTPLDHYNYNPSKKKDNIIIKQKTSRRGVLKCQGQGPRLGKASV